MPMRKGRWFGGSCSAKACRWLQKSLLAANTVPHWHKMQRSAATSRRCGKDGALFRSTQSMIAIITPPLSAAPLSARRQDVRCYQRRWRQLVRASCPGFLPASTPPLHGLQDIDTRGKRGLELFRF